MNRLDSNCRVYEPEILQTMGIAFDAAWDVLRKNCENRDSSRQKLACIIFRFVNEGETDALRICKLALNKIRFAKNVAPSALAVWNGLRSLPGRNLHVPPAQILFQSVDNSRHINANNSV